MNKEHTHKHCPYCFSNEAEEEAGQEGFLYLFRCLVCGTHWEEKYTLSTVKTTREPVYLDWEVLYEGQPVGSIREFIDTNREGNPYGVAPLSDEVITKVASLSSGETLQLPIGGGYVEVSRQ